jgi:hypothetical protein
MDPTRFGSVNRCGDGSGDPGKSLSRDFSWRWSKQILGSIGYAMGNGGIVSGGALFTELVDR